MHGFKLGTPAAVVAVGLAAIGLLGKVLETHSAAATRSARNLVLMYAGAAFVCLAPTAIRTALIVLDCSPCAGGDALCIDGTLGVECDAEDDEVYASMLATSAVFGAAIGAAVATMLYATVLSWRWHRHLAEEGTQVPWYGALTEFL